MTKRTAALISILFITCFLCISGCNQINAPTEVDIFGKNYIDLLHKADFKTAIQFHAPSITDIDASKMDEGTKNIQEEPFSAELIQSNKEFGSKNKYDLFYDVNANNKYFLVSLIVDNTDGKNQIAAFHLERLDKSAKELSTFTLTDKTPVHYLILVLAVIIPIFILITLIICIRTPIKKHKWLWIIFILLGIFRIKLNWTTGALTFSPFYAILFGASALKDTIPIEPWIISIALPLGAIIFLLQKNKIKQTITKTVASPTNNHDDT